MNILISFQSNHLVIYTSMQYNSLINICWLLYLIFYFKDKTKIKTFELIILFNLKESKKSYNSKIASINPVLFS